VLCVEVCAGGAGVRAGGGCAGADGAGPVAEVRAGGGCTGAATPPPERGRWVGWGGGGVTPDRWRHHRWCTDSGVLAEAGSFLGGAVIDRWCSSGRAAYGLSCRLRR
jgi:hypothetical protein